MFHRGRRNRRREPAELQITAFMNLMVVLVPFLLITAVFSQMAVLDLNLPDPSAESEQDEPPPRSLTVIIGLDALTVLDASGPLERFENNEAGYRFEALGELLQTVKDRLPAEEKITLLLAPDVEYETLIKAMDTVRLRPASKIEMFPLISIGDAPAASNNGADA